MLTISSQELQKQIGAAQLEAAKAPVIVTSHGRPRSVLMSVDEFIRLKELAGEPVAVDGLRKRAMTLRASSDELGYDVSDPHAAILRMARDANSGRTRTAVQAELAAVRRRYGGNPR
ncbi:prevent-host-death family protein [Bradyrhizobium erythrophlei]|nr:prevent-host-death family protein [Bradyrhizobium erythrophlei]